MGDLYTPSLDLWRQQLESMFTKRGINYRMNMKTVITAVAPHQQNTVHTHDYVIFYNNVLIFISLFDIAQLNHAGCRLLSTSQINQLCRDHTRNNSRLGIVVLQHQCTECTESVRVHESAILTNLITNIYS